MLLASNLFPATRKLSREGSLSSPASEAHLLIVYGCFLVVNTSGSLITTEESFMLSSVDYRVVIEQKEKNELEAGPANFKRQQPTFTL